MTSKSVFTVKTENEFYRFIIWNEKLLYQEITKVNTH